MTTRGDRGFTMIEMLVVMAVAAIIAAFAVARLSSAGKEERFVQSAARRVRERRAAALRLNPLSTATSLETVSQPPLTINFADLNTTRALKLEAPEGQPVTSFSTQTGTWTYVYAGEAIELPSGWRLATTSQELAPMPVINLGRFTSSVGFTADGRPGPQPALPTAAGESPFWAIYFTNGREARAVAVHSTGLVEVWRFDPGTNTWRGFGGRS